jgi:phosphoribosylanthranilate isomerase
MIVQIYEIQTPHEAEKCIELGVDHIGSVILSQNNWRVQSLKDVMNLSDGTGAKNSLIPLFRQSDTLYRAVDYYRPHYVHFCDSLTDDDGREIDLDGFIRSQAGLKDRFPEIDIIRSIPIPKKGSSPLFPTLNIARALEPVSDLFLTDTFLGKEPVKGFIGITGKTVDWETARELVVQSRIPVILAGGLSPENVYKAVMSVLPAGADTCTLTNTVDQEGRPERFKKDFQKVEAFVKEVRRAEKAIPTCLGNS